MNTPLENQFLHDAEATERAGAALAKRLTAGMLVLLHGELGAGKTTLVRGILRHLGHTGSVKSPTYTLVEPYTLAACEVLHFDFYRIQDARELEFIGIDELLDSDAIKLVEWPERAADRLPPAAMEVFLSPQGEGRRLDVVIA